MDYIDKYGNLYVTPTFDSVKVIETKSFFENGDFKSPFNLWDVLTNNTKAYVLPKGEWSGIDNNMVLMQVGLFNFCKAKALRYGQKNPKTTMWDAFCANLANMGCEVNYNLPREEVEKFIKEEKYYNYRNSVYLRNGNSRLIEKEKSFFLDVKYITQKYNPEAYDVKTQCLVEKGYLIFKK